VQCVVFQEGTGEKNLKKMNSGKKIRGKKDLAKKLCGKKYWEK